MMSRLIDQTGIRTAERVAARMSLIARCLVSAMILPTTLLTYFSDVYALQEHLEQSSTQSHQRTLNVFVEWLGEDPFVSKIDDHTLSIFLRDMESRYAPTTVRRFRANLLATTRHAAVVGLCGPPGRVRKTKVPPLIPEAWTANQVRRLLGATSRIERHGDYLQRFIHTGWDVGLRKGDLESLDVESIDSCGRAALRQAKTSEPIVITLRASTVDLLRACDKRFPLEHSVCLRQIYYWWAKLCLAAGVPHGGPQKLRRSAATDVELNHPGSATAFLGHKSADLARKHYLDPRILCRNPPMPEEL